MPHWLLDAWQKADAWTTTHSVVTVFLGTLFSLVMLVLTARILARIAAKLVIRRVFGPNGRLTLPAESARQAAEAQAEAARRIMEAERGYEEAIARMHTTMEDNVREMLDQTRRERLPLVIAVSTPEERQILEALLARVHQSRRVRVEAHNDTEREPAERDEGVQTAWSRLLTDDDEEGTPCPTTQTEPEPQSDPSPPRARKSPARRTPKKTKG